VPNGDSDQTTPMTLTTKVGNSVNLNDFTNNSITTSNAGLLPSPNPLATPKRLHVSNIPFRFRDPDLRNMFGVRMTLDDFVYDFRHIWCSIYFSTRVNELYVTVGLKC
jgi:hypothetical protein